MKKKVQIYLTDEQHSAIKITAGKIGQTVSGFISAWAQKLVGK